MGRAKLKTFDMPHALPEDKERETLLEFKAPKKNWKTARRKNKVRPAPGGTRTVTLQMCPLPKDYRPSPATQTQRMNELCRTRRKTQRKYRSDGTSKSVLDAHLKTTKEVPGPGHYTPGDPTMPTMPKVLMLPRRGAGALTPGGDNNDTPNSYFPTHASIDRRVTHGKWGKAAVDDSWRCAGEDTPGPGAHHTDHGLEGKSFAFGRFSVEVEQNRQLRAAMGSPGPGMYTNWKANRPASARTVIKPSDCRRYERFVAQIKTTEPGPGHYTPDRRQPTDIRGGKFNKARTVSAVEAQLRSRLGDSPGPGAYDSESDSRFVTHSGKVMMPAQTNAQDPMLKAAAAVPGPGEYTLPAAISTDALDGGKWRAPPARPQTAPAGQVQGEGGSELLVRMLDEKKVHGGAFAKARRAGISAGETEASKVPGPGAYSLPGSISNKGGKIAWLGRTLVLEDEAKRQAGDNDIGPGDYNTLGNGIIKNKNPWGTWRAASAESLEQPPPSEPGPGDYHVKRDSTQEQPGGMFTKETREGIQERRRLEEAAQVPGPGSYKLPKTTKPNGGRMYVYYRLAHDDEKSIITEED